MKRVVLPVDLDPKLSTDRLYIPEYLSGYLRKLDSLKAFLESPVVLDTLVLSPVCSQQDIISDWHISDTKSFNKHLEGTILTTGEPIAICLKGIYRLYNVRCAQCGIVSFNTRIVVEGPDASPIASDKCGFRQVGGLRDVIRLLISTVREPLLNKDLYVKYGITPPRGILLFGPPGTGKTLLVKALSEELAGTLVVSTNGTDLSGSDSFAKIHSLMETARQNCVESGYGSILIFIDEIDALCPSRERSVSESSRSSVAALLTEMDGLSAKTATTPLVVIGATNRPNSIDIALRRPGRFEREIEIAPPGKEDRKEILRVISKEKYSEIWNPSDADLEEIASRTHGFVGADLASLLSHSAFRALEVGEQQIRQTFVLEQLLRVRPSALRELAITIPKTTWNDIGGYQDVKDQLIEAVVWPLRYGDHFSRMGIEPPRGVLLYGPPGCSKTMMARAVATESSMNFIAVKGPELFSKWVGESEQAIRDLFRKARQASPCVIFFDEIDAIATQRDSGDGGVGNRVLTQLLTEMDGVSAARKLVVIAATNRPHVLDPALIRPGRLDRLVYVGLPDHEARVNIWKNGLRKVPHDEYCGRASSIEKLANMTEFYSGAEIVTIIKEASILCIKENVVVCSPDDISDRLASLSISPHEEPANLILLWTQLQKALGSIRPRTDPSSLSVFNGFKNRIT